MPTKDGEDGSRPDPSQAVLGIDFGATNLKGLLVDAAGHEYWRDTMPSEVRAGPEATMHRIVRWIESALDRAGDAGLSVAGIGVGACGPVNHRTGEIIESPVLPDWRNVPVSQPIGAATGLPVQLDNDANMAILGEWWRGAGQRQAVVAGITLGTGIGGGLIIDGHVYRGAWGYGAEFGHIRVASGPTCPCGGRGCLGRVASATATLDRYRRMPGASEANVQDLQELTRRARDGDQAARQAIALSVDYLAEAVRLLINALNPEVFILAGGMARLGSVLLEPIRNKVRDSTFGGLADTRIETASLDLYSGCYGAARLALTGAEALPRGERS